MLWPRVRTIVRRAVAAIADLSRREPLVAWAAVVAAAILIVCGHLVFLDPGMPLNQPDEGYLMAFAQRMHEGRWLPYVDAVSHRGPLLYWAGALVASFGEFSWRPIRLAALVVFVLPGPLGFLAARRAGFPLAGALGAVAGAFVGLALFEPVDGMAFSGEALMNVFLVASLLCLTRGLTGAGALSERWVAAAGALAMMGALCKQVGVVMLGPPALWALAAGLGHQELSRRSRWRLALAFPAGTLVPALLVLLPYAVAGELATLRYWLFTYNFEVYLFPFRGLSRWVVFRNWLSANLLGLTLASGAIAWGLARLVLAVKSARGFWAGYHQVGFTVTVALSAALGFVGAKMGMRDFPHYFLQVVPWLGLLCGLIAEPAQAPLSPRRLALYQALVLLPFLVFTVVVWQPRAIEQRRYAARYAPGRICAAIQEHSKPDDHIFVWGFWGAIHVDCQRRPASRYVFATFPSGFVPWFAEHSLELDDRLAVPGSRELLVDDLEDTQAALIVDAPSSLGGRPMRRYQKLGAYLDEHYYRVAAVGDVDVLARGKRDRRVLFDFERGGLEGWVLEGDAFGGPLATGAERGQGTVSGQQGQRFINSFTAARGDAATGRATSPVFHIDRSRLGLLMGGGKKGRVALEVDGTVVDERRGENAEWLREQIFDVTAHRGKSARLILIDADGSAWDHVLLDRVELFEPR
jgi:hypothetical protein